MKGQTFLLTSAVIIGFLVAIRGFSSVSHITSERTVLDISIEDLLFDNFKGETGNLIGINLAQPGNISTNSIDFLRFARNGSYYHGHEFRSLFVGILANSTNSTLNITVFNFLKQDNVNVTLTLNSSTVQTNSTTLNDDSIWINNFTHTPGNPYNLTIDISSINYHQNVTFETKGNKDSYTGFYDIRLITERASHFAIVQQTKKLN